MHKKIIIGFILLMIILIGIFIYLNVNIETEYTPETEIEDVEYRNTAISLYFQNKETKELQIETRLIDSKKLFKNPYTTLLNLLLEGPDTDTLESSIPSSTKLISTILEGECLVVNLSKEFLKTQNKVNERKNTVDMTLKENINSLIGLELAKLVLNF